MNIKRHLAIVQMSEHWHSFPIQAVEYASLKSDRTFSQKMSGHDPRYTGIGNSA